MSIQCNIQPWLRVIECSPVRVTVWCVRRTGIPRVAVGSHAIEAGCAVGGVRQHVVLARARCHRRVDAGCRLRQWHVGNVQVTSREGTGDISRETVAVCVHVCVSFPISMGVSLFRKGPFAPDSCCTMSLSAECVTYMKEGMEYRAMRRVSTFTLVFGLMHRRKKTTAVM